MTPLQHAAFKGRTDVCQLLLENGADVNSNHHENGYSALHFAALSGVCFVVHMIYVYKFICNAMITFMDYFLSAYCFMPVAFSRCQAIDM